MRSDSLDWPTLILGRAGAEFEVASPPELVDHLREHADRFGRAVGGHDRAGDRRAGYRVPCDPAPIEDVT
jgi:hypothetical protein